MVLVAVGLHAARNLQYLSVDSCIKVAFPAKALEKLPVVTLALADKRGKDEYALAGICCLDDADYLLLGIFHHLLPAGIAIGVGRARIEQTQIVIDLGYRADGRAGIAVGGLLLDGDYRRQSRNLVYVGPLHVAEKVARIGREGLYIPALSLSEDGVESQ